MNLRNNIIVLFACLSLSSVVAQDMLSLGFADIQTVVSTGHPGDLQHMKSGIIVRIVNERAKREIFTLSNEAGVAMVPLRPGSYCFSAFDAKGRHLELDAKQARCFVIHADKIQEVGVVVIGSRKSQ